MVTGLARKECLLPPRAQRRRWQPSARSPCRSSARWRRYEGRRHARSGHPLARGPRPDRARPSLARAPADRHPLAAVLPEGGYQFRRDASLQVTRYEASAAFSIPSGAGGLSISLRAPKSNSLAGAFTLNNQTPIDRDREADFAARSIVET